VRIAARSPRSYCLSALIFSLLVCAGCGGGNGGSSGGPGTSGNPGGSGSGSGQSEGNVTSVTVSGPATVQINACVSYIATVTGTGNYNRSVQWMVNGINGGSATLGTIDANGRYCAPPQSLSPPPNYVPVLIAAMDSGFEGSTEVTVLYPPPIITGISPQPATAGDQITITGQYIFPVLNVVFSDAVGGALPSMGSANNGNSITVTVPQGAVTGPVYLATPPDDVYPTQSNPIQFERLARLRIRSPQNDVAAGELITFQYALLGDATPRAVNFSADQGSFSGATYLAPAAVPSDTFVHITGCIAGTQVCDKQILGLHPFRIGPAVPIVALSQSLQLSALAGGGQVSANWRLLAGGGSINSTGLYQAGTQFQNGGPAIISALYSGTTEQTSVGVTGASPGLINRISDYIDQHDPNLHGTYAQGAAVIGNTLYIAASNHDGAYNDSYFWIDVYDVSDLVRPVWQTAVEANSAGPVFATGEYLYSYQNSDLAVPGYPNTVTLYSASGGVPVLKSRTQVPQWWTVKNNQGVVTVVPYAQPDMPNFGHIQVYDMTGGTIAYSDLKIALPPDANYYFADAALVFSNRLFLSIQKNDNQGAYILTYDASHLNLLGEINGKSLGFYAFGNQLYGADGGMDIYDISSPLPQWQSHVEYVNAIQSNGMELLAATEEEGCRLMDTTNPQNPLVIAVLFDGAVGGGNCGLASIVQTYIYVPESGGGLAIYDRGQLGGPKLKTQLDGGGAFSAAVYDMSWQGKYLYAADWTDLGAALNIYDMTNLPIRIGQYSDPSQEAYSLQVLGNYLYLGMSNNVGIFDISNPTSPTLLTNVPLQVLSFANAGNTLYAAMTNNQIGVYDVSNPTQPNFIRNLSLAAFPVRLRVVGNLLFAADGTGGLFIYSISSPTNPVLLSQVNGFASVNDVAVNGTTAFVAADVDGLGVLDISNPANPVLLSKTGLGTAYPYYFGTPNQAFSVVINNGTVYVGTINDSGLMFGFDCGNLAVPRLVTIYALPSGLYSPANWITSMFFDGTYMFVGGAINDTITVMELDMTQPFDSINQYFPPLALQVFGPTMPGNPRSLKAVSRRGSKDERRRARFFKTLSQ